MLGLVDLLLFVPILLALGIPALTEFISNSDTPKGVRSAIVVALSLLAAVVPTVPAVVLGAGTIEALGIYLVSVLAAWLTSGRAYLAGMADKQLRKNQGHVDLESPPTLDRDRV